MKKLYISLIILAILAVPQSHPKAEDINYGSIESAGFGEVSKILKNMTPQQRAEVKKQAKTMMPELEDMTQKEIDEFTQQLLSMESTIDASKIDAKSLDPKKTKGLKEIQKDIDNYLKK